MIGEFEPLTNMDYGLKVETQQYEYRAERAQSQADKKGATLRLLLSLFPQARSNKLLLVTLEVSRFIPFGALLRNGKDGHSYEFSRCFQSGIAV